MKLNKFHATGNLEADVIVKDNGTTEYEARQEIQPFLDQAKYDRENAKMQRGHMKKFATIPDIVAIEIDQKYGINIHDPNTMSDRNKMQRFKKIIMTEYKYLLSY